VEIHRLVAGSGDTVIYLKRELERLRRELDRLIKMIEALEEEKPRLPNPDPVTVSIEGEEITGTRADTLLTELQEMGESGLVGLWSDGYIMLYVLVKGEIKRTVEVSRERFLEYVRNAEPEKVFIMPHGVFIRDEGLALLFIA